MEIDLLKTKSKLDETQLELNDTKKSFLKQNKMIEMMKKAAYDKELQYNSLHESYQQCFNENRYLIETSTSDKSKLESKLNELQVKTETSMKVSDDERNSLKKSMKKKDHCIEKLSKRFNANQKTAETLSAAYKLVYNYQNKL